MTEFSDMIAEVGSILVEYLPLLDRIRCRSLSKDFLRIVDGSLSQLKAVRLECDLPLSHPNRQVKGLLWLSCKCPDLQNVSISGIVDAACRLRDGRPPWEVPRPLRGRRPSEGQPIESVIGATWARLRHLDLSAWGLFTEQGVTAIARGCPELIVLNLSNNAHVTDAALTIVADSCRQLKVLNVSGCRDVSDTGFFAVADRCRDLRELHASSKVTNRAVLALARGCTQLTVLRIRDSPHVTDAGITAVAQHCRQLHVLDISHCGAVGNIGLLSLLDTCTELRQLYVAGTSVNSWSLVALSALPLSLSALSLSRELGAAFLLQCPPVAQLADLQHLDLGAGDGMPTLDWSFERAPPLRLSALAGTCPDLRYLDLSDQHVQGGIAALAPKCPQLRTVLLARTSADKDDVLALATHCRQLHTLDLERCFPVGDAAVQHLARGCPRLEHVNLAACFNVSDDGLMALAKHCARLERVVWSDSGITKRGVATARTKLPRLQA
eukprot:jgi/Mesvir1/14402/Mv09788-RA.1